MNTDQLTIQDQNQDRARHQESNYPSDKNPLSLVGVPGGRQADKRSNSKDSAKRNLRFNPDLLPRKVLENSIKSGFSKPRISIGYRLNLLLVTFLIALLPVVYLATTSFFAWFIYWYGTTYVGLATDHGLPSLLFRYLVPIVAAGITLVFMLRPMFRKSAKALKDLEVSSKQEALFHTYLNQIADTVGAPRPAKVVLTLHANAAATFDGWIDFFKGSLTLIVGMPLIACLNTRQLAGVVAHEFGHFSQKSSMRSYYLIQTLMYWFSGCASDRKEWEEKLARFADEQDNDWIYWFVLAARPPLWLVSSIFLIMLWIAERLTLSLSRKMEFDADQFEIRLCGSSQFKETTIALNRTMIAYNRALDSNFEDHSQLSDDLTALTELFFMRQEDAIEKYIDANIVKRAPVHWSTHPCDRDRILAAVKTDAPCLYSLAVPASQLVKSYSELKQALTLRYYIALGFDPDKLELLPTEHKLEEVQAELESYDRINDLYQGFKLHTRIIDTGAFSKLRALDPEQRKIFKDKLDSKLSIAERSVDLHLRTLDRNLKVLVDSQIKFDRLYAAGLDSSDAASQLAIHKSSYRKWVATNKRIYALIGNKLLLKILDLPLTEQRACVAHIRTLRQLFKAQDDVDQLRIVAYRLHEAYALLLESEDDSRVEAVYRKIKTRTDALTKVVKASLDSLSTKAFFEGNFADAYRRMYGKNEREWDDGTEQSYISAFSTIDLFAEANDRTIDKLCALVKDREA